MANRWGNSGNSDRLYFWGAPKSLQMVDCSHEIKRHLLLGRKAMTNLDSILKSRDITLPTKVHVVKAMVFPVVMFFQLVLHQLPELLKFMSNESVMPSDLLILCRPLLLPPSIFSQHQGLFQWDGSTYQGVKLLELQLQHQSFQWIFRVDFL